MQIQNGLGRKREGVPDGNLFGSGGFRAAIGADLAERIIGKRDDFRLSVASENPLLRTQEIVHARVVLIHGTAAAIARREVTVGTVRQVGLREERQEGLRGGVDSSRR